MNDFYMEELLLRDFQMCSINVLSYEHPHRKANSVN